METVPAGGDDGGLELQDGFISQTCGISQVARRATDSGHEAIVGVHAHENLMGQA